MLGLLISVFFPSVVPGDFTQSLSPFWPCLVLVVPNLPFSSFFCLHPLPLVHLSSANIGSLALWSFQSGVYLLSHWVVLQDFVYPVVPVSIWFDVVEMVLALILGNLMAWCIEFGMGLTPARSTWLDLVADFFAMARLLRPSCRWLQLVGGCCLFVLFLVWAFFSLVGGCCFLWEAVVSV
ncbi:hypothetical protein RchiOBHm_Chr7g0214711 [Rosa chinensis]|uniref:Transmembrane protein n=1 Tax=Rosa chinensis TaxID=74649 RepID=A0A2P6PBA3_ROSCH|nr:hypothetical protein RchiOBHm_Chr7g0214711 [Rosa chinensis]